MSSVLLWFFCCCSLVLKGLCVGPLRLICEPELSGSFIDLTLQTRDVKTLGYLIKLCITFSKHWLQGLKVMVTNWWIEGPHWVNRSVLFVQKCCFLDLSQLLKMFKIWEISRLYSDFLWKNLKIWHPQSTLLLGNNFLELSNDCLLERKKDPSSLPQSPPLATLQQLVFATVATSPYISSPSLCHSPHHPPFYYPQSA